jgi:multicomponent Na+:H+ antiporter subunit D
MPWTMAAFVLGGFSLIGVPLTTGFISKWILLQASFEGGHWVLAAAILLSSVLAVIYVWRVVELAYFSEPGKSAASVQEAPLSMLIPTWILIAANLYFGIDTDLTVGVATKAAAALLGITP